MCTFLAIVFDRSSGVLTCIDLFNYIEVSFIVCILYTASSPWNGAQLTRG